MHGGLRKKAKIYKTFAFPEICRSGDFKAYISPKIFAQQHLQRYRIFTKLTKLYIQARLRAHFIPNV